MPNFVKMHKDAWIHPRCLLIKWVQLHKFIKTTWTESFHMVLQQNKQTNKKKSWRSSLLTLVQKEFVRITLWCQSLKVPDIQAFKWQTTNNILKIQRRKQTHPALNQSIFGGFFCSNKRFFSVVVYSRLFSASFSCEFSCWEFSLTDSVLFYPKM